MKLLVVSNMYPDKSAPSYGVFVKNFCQQLQTLGIDYDLSVMHKSNSKIGKVLGYVAFYFGTALKMLLREYEIVYVHYASHSSPPVLWVNKLKKSRLFVNVHGSDVVPENAKQEKMQKYTRRILEISERVIVPSIYFKDYVREKYQLHQEKIMVYPSAGVDPTVFHRIKEDEKRRMIRSKWGLPDDKPVFGMIGRVSAGKGWDTFLKAVARYLGQYQNAHFLFVGNGPEYEEAVKLIHSADYGEGLTVIGQLVAQQTLMELYNAVDYLVFPTQREGESLGLVALEAMACGTPVIASAYAAPNYYVEDGMNGFKFTMGDSEELCRKMQVAVETFCTVEYQKMCQQAYHTASGFFFDAIAMDLKEILESKS